jgi:hypothetical protein
MNQKDVFLIHPSSLIPHPLPAAGLFLQSHGILTKLRPNYLAIGEISPQTANRSRTWGASVRWTTIPVCQAVC